MQVRAVGGWQLWPRKFWMWAAGGLTVAEAVLLAAWTVMHAVMLWNWFYAYTKPYDYGEGTHWPALAPAPPMLTASSLQHYACLIAELAAEQSLVQLSGWS